MIIAVEANIGAGKTTLLSLLDSLKLKKEHIVLFEQVGEWTSLTDSNNESIFDLFYKDKKRYSYVFQSYVLFSRLQHFLDTVTNNPDKIIICERSILSDFEIFAKSLYEMNTINEIEWTVYTKWHGLVTKTMPIKVEGIIYLRTSPEVCFTRIQKRARQSENNITQDYLDILHKKHEEWLMNDETRKIPMLMINGNQDLLSDNTILKKELSCIEMFVNGLLGAL
jgi:deoxyadenosine/deoxycytidine kinase